MEDNALNFTLWQVAFAYIFLVVVLIIVHIKKIPRRKLLIISSLHMTLQFIIVSYILVYVLDNPYTFIASLVILIMLSFAIIYVYQRTEPTFEFSLNKMIALMIMIGVDINLIYFMFVILQFVSWYEPQNSIPVSGMIIG